MFSLQFIKCHFVFLARGNLPCFFRNSSTVYFLCTIMIFLHSVPLAAVDFEDTPSFFFFLFFFPTVATEAPTGLSYSTQASQPCLPQWGVFVSHRWISFHSLFTQWRFFQHHPNSHTVSLQLNLGELL